MAKRKQYTCNIPTKICAHKFHYQPGRKGDDRSAELASPAAKALLRDQRLTASADTPNLTVSEMMRELRVSNGKVKINGETVALSVRKADDMDAVILTPMSEHSGINRTQSNVDVMHVKMGVLEHEYANSPVYVAYEDDREETRVIGVVNGELMLAI